MCSARAQAASTRCCPWVSARRMMPSAERYPCSGCRLRSKDPCHQGGGRRAGLLGPRHDAPRRPLGMAPMGLGHVGGVGGVAEADEAAQVTGHPAVSVQDLDGGRRGAGVDLLAGELVGDGVVVLVRLDVVVDVHPRLAPGAELVALTGKRAQRRSVEALEELLARTVHLLEGPGVQLLQAHGDGRVGLGQRVEAAVSEHGDDPSLGHEHSSFRFGLVPRLSRPRRDDRHGVVLGELLVGEVHVGLITMGPRHRRAQVVRHRDVRRAAEELQCVDVAGHEVQELLGAKGLGVGVGGGTQAGHEQLRLEGDRVAVSVVDGDGGPGEVDEHLLAGAVVLAHHDVDLLAPFDVAVAELAVAEALWMLFAVLEPQQLQGHALALELFVDRSPVRQRPPDGRRRRGWEQRGFERGVVHVIRQRPADAGRLGPPQVLTDRGDRDAGRGGHLTARQAVAVGQPQDVSDLAHGRAGSGHSGSPPSNRCLSEGG